MLMQTPPAHIRTLHFHTSSSQAPIARAVVGYAADVMGNVGVVASFSLGVMQTL